MSRSSELLDCWISAGERIGSYCMSLWCGVTNLVTQGALKMIKLGMDTRSMIARFEAERQALALMDHVEQGNGSIIGSRALAEDNTCRMAAWARTNSLPASLKGLYCAPP